MLRQILQYYIYCLTINPCEKRDLTNRHVTEVMTFMNDMERVGNNLFIKGR